MKRNSYLSILAVVTLVCIIVGVYFQFSARKKTPFKFSYSGWEKHMNDEADNGVIRIEKSGKFKNEDVLEKFKNVSVKANVMAVSFKRGDKFSIESEYTHSSLEPAYSVVDGKLMITQPAYKNVKIKNGNSKCEVVVTVPYGTIIDDLFMDIDVGAVSLKGFDVKNCEIKTDVGAVEVKNVEFENLKIDTDVGAVSIALVDDVKDYSIKASSDVGGLSIGGVSYKRNYTQDGKNGKKIKVSADVGAVEIK